MNVQTLPDPAAASPAVQRWQQRFAETPQAALDALLTARVALGPYDRARPAGQSHLNAEHFQ